MSQDDLATIFRRAMEAYSRGDYEAALVGFDPAIEWSVQASLAPDATTYRGHEVLSMPTPSSGGAVLIEMHNILEAYDQSSLGWSSSDC